ncbi:MAG: glycosyltransferase family 9 protein [Rudaea sp.]
MSRTIAPVDHAAIDQVLDCHLENGASSAKRRRALQLPWARLKSRALRRRVVRWILGFVFRSAESTLAGVGQVHLANIHRILVLRPNHRLGNTLLLTPLIAELEHTLPGAEIDVLVAGPAAQEALGSFFALRRIHPLPRYIVRHLITTARMIATMRKTRYDLAIDPSAGSLSSRLLLAWIKPRFAIGVPDTQLQGDSTWARVMFSAPRHLAKLPIFVLRHALASSQTIDKVDYPGLNIRLTPVERHGGRRALKTLIDLGGKGRRPTTVGIFANASGGKCFSETWWSAFLTTLAKNHPEYAIVEFVAMDGRSRLGGRFPTYYSSSPRKMASVMSSLTCFVSGDCGVMHLACASEVPTVGLFSVTDLSMYEPYGHNNKGLRVEGKSPEQVAQTVARIVETLACGGTIDPGMLDLAEPPSMASVDDAVDVLESQAAR